jgi:thiol:disulfide interchange protein DsbA
MLRTLRLLALAALVLPLTTLAAGFEEGRHYTELAFPQPVETGNQIEVREFFWYGCPHCYTLEPTLERWIATKPKNVAFVRTPGTAPRWLVHAQAFYAADSLGVSAKLHSAMFKAMHEQKRPLDDEASLLKFVAEQGVDAAKFKAALNSFGTKLNVEKAKRLNEAHTINSVPALVVDGKYQTSPAMAGGEAAVIKVVEHLVQKAQAARNKR